MLPPWFITVTKPKSVEINIAVLLLWKRSLFVLTKNRKAIQILLMEKLAILKKRMTSSNLAQFPTNLEAERTVNCIKCTCIEKMNNHAEHLFFTFHQNEYSLGCINQNLCGQIYWLITHSFQNVHFRAPFFAFLLPICLFVKLLSLSIKRFRFYPHNFYSIKNFH